MSNPVVGELADAVMPNRTTADGVPSFLHSHPHGRMRRCCTWSERTKSHVIEWILTITVIVIPLACAVFLIPFRDRSISLLDASIQQPYLEDDSLPILSVFIPSSVIPIIFFVVYPLMLSKHAEKLGLPAHKYSLHLTYWWVSALVQSIALTVLLSELSKRLVQAPRPDFLDRCFPAGVPDAVMSAAKATNYIINTNLCTPKTKAIYDDGLQSLPSEHTSLSWTMMTVLIMFFYTLRRELVAHAIRASRSHRVGKRAALVERLIAAGVPHSHARIMAQSVGTPGSATPGRVRALEKVDPCPSPELRPPALVEEYVRTDRVPDGPIASFEQPEESVLVSQQGGGGLRAYPSVSASPMMSESSCPPQTAGSRSEAPATAAAAPRPNGAAQAQGAPHRSGRRTESGGPAPVYWPNSHVVYIAHVLLPFGWAVSVSLSRTFDHRHSPSDVLAGALIGIAVAYAVYSMHLVKFQGYHRRWREEEEWEEMDIEAARGSEERHRRRKREVAATDAKGKGQGHTDADAVESIQIPLLHQPQRSPSPCVQLLQVPPANTRGMRGLQQPDLHGALASPSATPSPSPPPVTVLPGVASGYGGDLPASTASAYVAQLNPFVGAIELEPPTRRTSKETSPQSAKSDEQVTDVSCAAH